MGIKLTNIAVERFQCRDGRQYDILWDGELKGFGVRVSKKRGTRTYILQYRVKGSKAERHIKIGRHNDPWRVDQARQKAMALKALMLDGVDPVEKAERDEKERLERAARDIALSTTLRQVMNHYLEHKRTKHGPLRPASKKDIIRHVTVNMADWIDKPIGQITRDTALAKFLKITERGALRQANACMAIARGLCNHAREMHAAEDGTYPLLAVNPITQMFKLRKANPEKERTNRVPLNKVGAVWLMLRKRAVYGRSDPQRTAADWVSTMILTGTRLTESASLKRADVNLAERTIRLRDDVVKNHNDMILPMSSVLHEILLTRLTAPPDSTPAARRRVRTRDTEYVFPSWGRKKPYMYDARATLEAVSKVAGCHISAHALRRTAEDIAKKVKVDPDERRQLLNHVAEDVHGKSYANNPDPEVLRPGIEAMARFLTEAAELAEAQASGANVVPLFGGSAV